MSGIDRSFIVLFLCPIKLNLRQGHFARSDRDRRHRSFSSKVLQRRHAPGDDALDQQGRGHHEAGVDRLRVERLKDESNFAIADICEIAVGKLTDVWTIEPVVSKPNKL